MVGHSITIVRAGQRQVSHLWTIFWPSSVLLEYKRLRVCQTNNVSITSTRPFFRWYSSDILIVLRDTIQTLEFFQKVSGSFFSLQIWYGFVKVHFSWGSIIVYMTYLKSLQPHLDLVEFDVWWFENAWNAYEHFFFFAFKNSISIAFILGKKIRHSKNLIPEFIACHFKNMSSNFTSIFLHSWHLACRFWTKIS